MKKIFPVLAFFPLILLFLTGAIGTVADTEPAEEAQRVEVYPQLGQSNVKSLAFSPDGKYLASGAHDNSIKLWDVETGREIITLLGHSSTVSSLSVTFSPDGKIIASGSTDKTIKLWDAATGRAIRTLSGHSDMVNFLAFSPDGAFLLSNSRNTIKLWNTQTWQEVRTFRGHSSDVLCAAFSSDGKTVISGSYDKTIKFWDAATGQVLRTSSGISASCGAFSPDGKTFASISSKYAPETASWWIGELTFWDAETGKEIRTVSAHSHRVNVVTYSPDGKIIATGGRDKTIRLWDAATGSEIRSLTDGQRQ